MKPTFRGLAIACAWASAGVLAAAQCPSTIADADMTGWAPTTLLNIPATNPSTCAPVASGGNPGAAYQVTQSVTSNVVNAQTWLAHFPPTAAPLPLTGLGRADLSMDARCSSVSPNGAFGNVVGLTFAVEQDGVIYSAPSTYSLLFVGAGWGVRTAIGLTATSFTRPDGLPGHPDFA
ncbi:MAG TPA: hypothetical protein VEI02_16425, partial [Planctomycetota bacterium]|nr:hypothetical protein [Planctomycetota bacterium]